MFLLVINNILNKRANHFIQDWKGKSPIIRSFLGQIKGFDVSIINSLLCQIISNLFRKYIKCLYSCIPFGGQVLDTLIIQNKTKIIKYLKECFKYVFRIKKT